MTDSAVHHGLRNFFSSLVILALAGAVGYLLSERNARRLQFLHERRSDLPIDHDRYPIT
jgi:hypothetical protein